MAADAIGGGASERARLLAEMMVQDEDDWQEQSRRVVGSCGGQAVGDGGVAASGNEDAWVAPGNEGSRGPTSWSRAGNMIVTEICCPDAYFDSGEEATRNGRIGGAGNAAGAAEHKAAKRYRVVLSPSLQAKVKELGLTEAQVLVVGLMLQQPWLIPAKVLAGALLLDSVDTVKRHVGDLVYKFGAADKWDMLEKAARAGFKTMQIEDLMLD